MRLGAPVFVKATDPEAWAAAHVEAGYSAAYVPGDSEEVAKACAAAAAKRNILLAEVGAWSNTIAPDAATRKKAIELCSQRLALADSIGAVCCVNIAGSLGERWDGPYPENLSKATFDLVVQVVRQIVDSARPTRSFYTLEPMPWVLPDSPDSYLSLIKAVDRKQFAVHLDVVNMVNCPSRAYRTGDFIRECFAKLGPWIKSCHAKDIKFSQHLTIHLDECAPGEGVIDFGAYLRELNKLARDTPMMIEHLKDEQSYRNAATHIRGEAKKAGVQFI